MVGRDVVAQPSVSVLVLGGGTFLALVTRGNRQRLPEDRVNYVALGLRGIGHWGVLM